MFYVRQMNSACGLRISQCELRLRTGCQHIANLAMRNFAKVLWEANFAKVQCTGAIEFRNAKLVANTLRNSQWLRTVCEQFAKILFCCFFFMSLILSSTASHFFHFSFVFPLIFGLVDG